MNGIGARIRQARKAKGMTLEALALACGWEGAGRISNYESGRRPPGIDDLQAIAGALGVSFMWLATGQGQGPDRPNVEPGPDLRGMVPVISWVAAGAWDEAVDHLPPGDGDDWIPCPAQHSRRTYALRVRGDSMTAPHGKSYPEGCIIFVDPERRAPASGQPVIAKVNGDNAVTFKVFTQDAGRAWLRALNPAYPPIMDEFRVLGTVIGKWEDA